VTSSQKTVENALERIRAQHKGVLDPEDVVSTAKSPKHPLHSHFVWDDSVAGHRFRLEQAAVLIRSIKVLRTEVVTGSPKKIAMRKYVSGNDIGSPTRGYRVVSELNEREKSNLLASIERDLRALEQKYTYCAEFFETARKRYSKQRLAKAG
jgi:hypothetical protein